MDPLFIEFRVVEGENGPFKNLLSSIMVNHDPDKEPNIRPALETPRYDPANVPDPFLGGDGYSEDVRRMVVDLYAEQGREDYMQMRQNAPINLHGHPNLPHWRTVERYIERINTTGRNIRYQHTGNNRADDIKGFPLILLSYFRRAFPKATRYQCIAFLWRAHSSMLPIPRVYSANDITNAENRIGLNWKKGSTTAHQAYTPANLQRRWMYWNLPFPNGIANIPAQDMIDLDECGIKLETANRKYGKASLSRRVRERGNYGHGVNHTLMMAISGGPNHERWRRFSTNATNILSFVDFIDDILTDLPQGIPGNRKCFTMDNYIVHHSPVVLAMITNAGHRYAFRSPYWPVDGPIEYVFNTIECALAYRMYDIHTVGHLETHVDAIIRTLPGFEVYFVNCGFN